MPSSAGFMSLTESYIFSLAFIVLFLVTIVDIHISLAQPQTHTETHGRNNIGFFSRSDDIFCSLKLSEQKTVCVSPCGSVAKSKKSVCVCVRLWLIHYFCDFCAFLRLLICVNLRNLRIVPLILIIQDSVGIHPIRKANHPCQRQPSRSSALYPLLSFAFCLLSSFLYPLSHFLYNKCCFKIITYLLVTPSILFFCIADTTTALKRCADMGAWMMWVCCQPVLFRIRR